LAPIDRRISLWAPVVAYLAFIFALSSIANTPQLPDGADKDAHALLYAGLGVLFVRARAGGVWRPVTWGMVAAAAIFAAFYGASDEFHQWFVPPRQVEAADVLADTIGATLAALALRLRSRLVHGI
jgi:VanZ family protein